MESEARLKLGELVRQAESVRARNQAVNAVYQSGSIIALGATLYFGCCLYSALSELKAAVEGVTMGVDFNPAIFDEGAYEVLNAHYSRRGWLHGQGFRVRYAEARSQYQDTGEVRAAPWANHVCERWEKVLVQHGYLGEEDRVAVAHPIDKLTGEVLSNKWYWGVVLGLAALPAVPVVRDVIENVEVEVR